MSGSRTDEETHTSHCEKHRRRRKKANRKQEKERRQEEKERRRNEERKRRAQKKKSRRQKAREQEKAVLLKQQQEIARQEAMSTYFQCSICDKSVLRFDYFRHHALHRGHFVCPICKNIYKDQVLFQQHQATHKSYLFELTIFDP